MAEFRASVRQRAGATVVDLHGQIDMAADGPLAAAYAEAAGLGPGAIVLNFEEVDYINSTGIALIVGLLARARKERRAIGACGLTDHYREIFEIPMKSDRRVISKISR